eukprot:366144-Chlamydomonas_euryale.AAC.6
MAVNGGKSAKGHASQTANVAVGEYMEQTVMGLIRKRQKRFDQSQHQMQQHATATMTVTAGRTWGESSGSVGLTRISSGGGRRVVEGEQPGKRDVRNGAYSQWSLPPPYQRRGQGSHVL